MAEGDGKMTDNKICRYGPSVAAGCAQVNTTAFECEP